MDLATAMQAVVDRLTAGDVRAVVDPRDLNPPAVLVRAPTVSWRFGKGGWDAQWEAWAVVPGSGTSHQLKAVGELITQVQDALGYAAVTARPDDAVLADGSTVPMYVLTWTQRIPA